MPIHKIVVANAQKCNYSCCHQASWGELEPKCNETISCLSSIFGIQVVSTKPMSCWMSTLSREALCLQCFTKRSRSTNMSNFQFFETALNVRVLSTVEKPTLVCFFHGGWRFKKMSKPEIIQTFFSDRSWRSRHKRKAKSEKHSWVASESTTSTSDLFEWGAISSRWQHWSQIKS